MVLPARNIFIRQVWARIQPLVNRVHGAVIRKQGEDGFPLPAVFQGRFYWKNAMRKNGFTLIETVLVIIILSVVAVVLSTHLGGFYRIKVNGAAEKLASDIRFAQQLATTHQIIHGAAFTPTGYTIYENDAPADPAHNPQGGGDFIVNYTTGELSGISVATTLPAGIVKFNPAGEALQSDGSPLPAGSNAVTLSYQGQSRTLTIIPATGRVNY